MDSPYAREFEVAIAAVQAAASLSSLVLAQAQSSGGGGGEGGGSGDGGREGGGGGSSSVDDGLGVVSKDDLSPVTVADFAIQALLTCTIHAAFPDDKFVGEESADALRANPALLDRVWTTLQQQQQQQQQQQHTAALVRIPESPEHMCQVIDWCGTGHPGRGGRIWVFDPIDGTENFVRGLVYAVNVALLHDGQQALSVVACPNLSAAVAYPATDDSLDPAGEGCILLAARGHGAFVRTLHDAGGRADMSSSSSSSSPPITIRRLPSHADQPRLLSTTARNTSGLAAVHQEVARRLGVEYPGSTLLPWVVRWALLALGVGNSTWWVYKSRARLAKIWDHAGAMLLFEEVGGRVSDVDGRAIDLTADRKMTANYGIVAAPAHLHAALLATVQEVLREQRPDLATLLPAS